MRRRCRQQRVGKATRPSGVTDRSKKGTYLESAACFAHPGNTGWAPQAKAPPDQQVRQNQDVECIYRKSGAPPSGVANEGIRLQSLRRDEHLHGLSRQFPVLEHQVDDGVLIVTANC